MTAAAWGLLAAAGLAAALDWFAVARGRRGLVYVAKPATLALLVAVAVALQPVHAAVRWWVVAALVLSLAGDVLLMLPTDLFLAGLGAFFVGHVCYVVGLQLEQRSWALAAVGLAVVAVSVAAIGRRLVASVRAKAGAELLGPVVAYVAVISLMVISAWGTAVAVTVAGALAFYVSDATLAWNRFVHAFRHADLAVMVTYHLGQAGLVLGLVVH